MSDDDDNLMIRVQSGESGAFQALVERHQGALLGFFLRNTRDRALAEDLTQETLLRVYNQAWDYLPVGKFRGWMYRMARNLLIDNVRRQAHDALVRAVRPDAGEDQGLARLAGEVLSAEEHAGVQEVSHVVDGLLKELPEEQRLTFVLYHYSGLSLPEVAEIMECPLPTCKSRLRLARDRLREQLLERGFEDPSPDAADE